MEHANAETVSGETMPVHQLTIQDMAEIVANETADDPPGPPLPPHYELGPLDICNGRGKSHWNMPGNVTFRQYIQEQVHSYLSKQTKGEKTRFVNQTLRDLRAKGYKFLSESPLHQWYDIGDAQAKNKIAHSLRDQVSVLRKAMRTRPDETSQAIESAVIATLAASTDNTRKRKAEGIHNAEAAMRLLQQRAAKSIAAAAAASKLKAHASTRATPSDVRAIQDESTMKTGNDRADDTVHMAALRTRLTQVIGDLNSERQVNRHLEEENANLRKEAEKSHAEFIYLRKQVQNLSSVVQELWSHQGGTLDSLNFLSADAIQTVAQVVGMPSATRDDGSDTGSEKVMEDEEEVERNHIRDEQRDAPLEHLEEALEIGGKDKTVDI